MSQTSKPSANRREFLKTSSALAASGAVAGTVMSPSTSRAGYHVFGSDTIRVGVIGSGGRGSGAMADALNAQSGNVEVTAVGDLFADRPEGALGGLKERYKDRIKVNADTTFIGFDAYKKVLETDCQIVILATPPGFRPLHFEAAVAAGKGVFMEKPVAVDPPGVQRVLRASEEAKKKSLPVQVGLQRRHERAYMETIQRLKDGIIGDLIAARVYWNQGFLWVAGRRPEQTELEYQIRNWLYFNWLSGDHLVEQHIHNLDVINWLMDDYPVKAEGMGGRQVRTGPQHGEIFDHHAIEYTYANGVKMFSQCRQIAGCWNEVAEYAHYTKGYADISAGRIFDLSGKEIFRSEGSRGGHGQEHVDMYADLARGLIPNEGEYGAKSTMTAILGRMSTYSGKSIRWDDAMKSERKLADVDAMTSLQSEAPVKPLENGEYEIPVPGAGWEKVLDWNPDKRS